MTLSLTKDCNAGAILFIAILRRPEQDGDDQSSIHQKSEEVSSLLSRHIQQHNGNAGMDADGSSIVCFRQVRAAVQCAIDIQKDLLQQNRKVTLNRPIHLTMGIHLVYNDTGESNPDDDHIRIAKQLAALAAAGQILVSKDVQGELVEDSFTLEHLGVRELVPRRQPMDIYRIVLPQMKEPIPESIRSFYPENLTRFLRILFALGIIALLLWYFWTSFPLSRAGYHSIAVLPFVSLDSNPDHNALSELICSNLIEHLSADNRGNVLSLSQVMPYKNSTKSIQEIAAELQAGFIVEGVFKVEDEYIQLVVHLTETSGQVLWSKEYDLALTDLARIEDDMAAGISKAIMGFKHKSGR